MERDEGLQKQFKKQLRPTRKKGGPALLPPTPQPKSPKVLMIYVRFDDESNINASAPASQTLFNMMYDGNAFGTVAHYYKTVTNNVANITPAEVDLTTTARARADHQGIVFVTISGQHKDWDVRNDLGGPGGFRADVVKTALEAADAIVNFARFDANGNGILETSELSIGFIVHGYEESTGLTGPDTPSVWGHASALGTPVTLDGVRVSNYFAQGAFQTSPTATPPNQLLTIGIIAHELGHSGFGFLDLYDTSYTVQGVGLWSLMASGSWGAKSGEPSGSTPTALDAYHLQSLLDPQSGANGSYTLSGAHQYARLTTSKPNQYFLLQARGNVGYDQGFACSGGSWPSPGVILYHVDDDMSGGNNRSSYPHLHVAVEEAHGGIQHLSTSRSNSGEANDLFGPNGKTSFGDTTDPNANLYDSSALSGQNTPSGVTIGSIAASVAGFGNSGTVDATFTTLEREAPPSITAHPQSQTKAPGERASFSVQIKGGNGALSYEWKIWDHLSGQWGNPNPSYYGGVGTDTLTIARVQAQDNGDKFYCVVKDGSSSETSNTATLTVSGGGDGDDGGGGCDSGFFSAASALLVLFSLLVVWKK
jgi:M6 family metalloprotease-like protein